jgi:hypothetical protein
MFLSYIRVNMVDHKHTHITYEISFVSQQLQTR